jgi:hypothetical protein
MQISPRNLSDPFYVVNKTVLELEKTFENDNSYFVVEGIDKRNIPEP